MNFDPRPTTTPPDKLGEMMLYIAQRCASDSNFGATRLNKTLFYTDVFSYLKKGKTVTGATYMKLPQGPAPRQLLPAQNRLLDRGDAVIEPRPVTATKIQKRLVALRDPDISAFDASDIQIVEAVLCSLHGKTADMVSEMTHDRMWKIARDREDIPFQTAFLSEAPASPYDSQRGLDLAAEKGWSI